MCEAVQPRYNSILAIWPIKSNHPGLRAQAVAVLHPEENGFRIFYVFWGVWSPDYRNSSRSYCAMRCNSAKAPDTHGPPVGTFILFSRRKHYTIVGPRSGEWKSPYANRVTIGKPGRYCSRHPRKHAVESVGFRSK